MRRLVVTTAIVMLAACDAAGPKPGPAMVAANAAGLITLCVPDSRPPSPAATQAAFRVLRSLDEVRTLIEQVL